MDFRPVKGFDPHPNLLLGKSPMLFSIPWLLQKINNSIMYRMSISVVHQMNERGKNELNSWTKTAGGAMPKKLEEDSNQSTLSL
jgi:hypothetical protein